MLAVVTLTGSWHVAITATRDEADGENAR